MNLNALDIHGRFCEHCDVSLDLHDDPVEPSEWDCENAHRKARLIETFWTVRS